MKKLGALFLSLMLVLSLAGCGSKASAPETSAVAETAAEQTSEEAAENASAVSEETKAEGEIESSSEAAGASNPSAAAAQESSVSDSEKSESAAAVTAIVETTAAAEVQAAGKTLVVYYSASGNTARVANDIAEAADAELFEIVPTEVYTDDDLNWTDSNSRVSREHDDESLRNVPLTATEVPNWSSYDTVFIGYPIWWGIAAWPVDGFVKANDFSGKTVIPFATSSSSGMGQSGTLLAEMAGSGNWQAGQRFSSGASSADVQSWVNGLGL